MVLIVCASLASTGSATAGPEDEFFETRIRPLLAERCFSCHSHTSGKSKGGLKLDRRDTVFRGGDSGPAVMAGQPAESLLLKAVRRNDTEVSAMPPDEPLSAAHIRDLEQWIADGAAFPEMGEPASDPLSHWAFQPVSNPPVPEVTAINWPQSDIDRFLLSKMEQTGLQPADDAEPMVVARRLAFALTGLPPTLEELDVVRQGGHAALEGYVDRLLESPHFGERWARHWMDLVRYADSAGHEYDYEFEGAWRYRDYLVRAFNDDVPFNQFVREHVAGDLLPPRVKDGRNEALLGTGWWQLQEQASAPVDLANDEAERLDNQLDVLGKTFQALTVGCARCHDHKFDPIRTREYYGLFGIAAASPAHRTWANGPALAEVAARLKELRDRRDATEPSGIVVTPPALSLDNATLLGDFATGLPEGWALTGHAEVVTGETAALRGRQPGLWTDTLSRKLPSYVRSPQFTIEHDHVDVLVAGADSMVQLVIANYQMIRGPIYDGLKKKIESPEPHWLRIYIGRWKGRRAHLEVFTGTADPEHRILHTSDRETNWFGLRAVVLSHGDSPPVPESIAGLRNDSGPPTFDETHGVGLAEEYAHWEQQIPAQERFLGVQDVNGADVPVYARGDANKPRDDKPSRKFLSVARVDHAPPQAGSGRREIAEVLVSPENPLTARVFVNRVWHHLFGRGLVPTVDNFGLLGERPSHPELLDFLAYRFVHEHQWSVKRLLRELVLTRAFQIQGGPAPEVDATNTLLSRFPLRRLEAEAVRDAILAVSGQLDPTFGGEPIPVPHQLKGTGSDSGNNYPESGPVDGNRRRSLYLASRRNFPSTFLDVFDKPPPLGTFGRRDVSTVPTQALTLMNDPFVAEQARAWAARTAGAAAAADDRIAEMFLEAFARLPMATEREQAMSLVSLVGWDDLALALFNTKEFIHVP
jgi:hypothetical protein